MKVERGEGRQIPWWRTPGALIAWALIAATLAVWIGEPLVVRVAKTLLGDAELAD